MSQSLDVVEKLRELGSELIDIGVAVNEPFELVARIGAVSFMLHWIADGLERELAMAAERGRLLKEIQEGRKPYGERF